MKKLSKTYKLKKQRIRNRLNDFQRFYHNSVSWFYDDSKLKLKKVNKEDNERLFEELTFCLLTANTSAEMSLKAIDNIREILLSGTIEDIQNKLKESGYRFPNKRAEYIFEAREKLRKNHDFDIKGIIERHDDVKKLRKWFAQNIKGLGYKESSHFLRNIGVFGLAILDKHVLRTLEDYDVIDMPKYMNKKNYLEIEEKYKEFSSNLEIDMDELDLLLWSMKNGRILK